MWQGYWGKRFLMSMKSSPVLGHPNAFAPVSTPLHPALPVFFNRHHAVVGWQREHGERRCHCPLPYIRAPPGPRAVAIILLRFDQASAVVPQPKVWIDTLLVMLREPSTERWTHACQSDSCTDGAYMPDTPNLRETRSNQAITPAM